MNKQNQQQNGVSKIADYIKGMRKSQKEAFKQVMEEERSLGGALRNLKRLAKEYQTLQDSLSSFQQSVLLDNPNAFADCFKAVFSEGQQRKWRQDKVTRYKVILRHDDENVETLGRFDSREKAQARLKEQRKQRTKRYAQLLDIEEYPHQYQRSFSAYEMLVLSQKLEQAFLKTYTENRPDVTVPAVKMALGLTVTNEERAQVTGKQQRKKQSERDKATAKRKNRKKDPVAA